MARGTTAKAMTGQYFTLLEEWNAAYDRYAKSTGLSGAALSVLRLIVENEGTTQKQIESRCFLSKQTINAAVTMFYRKGWLYMKNLAEDRRLKGLYLTDEGKSAIQKLLGPAMRCEREAMESLAEEDREALLRITNTYVKNCVRILEQR